MNVLHKIFKILLPSEIKGFRKVLFLCIGLSFFEIAGIASVMPFLGVIGSPNVIEDNLNFSLVFESLISLNMIENINQFIVLLGISSFLIITFAAIFRSFTQYFNNRFIEDVRHQLSKRILEIYISQPYEFFMNRHSSELSKNILSDVDQSVERVIKPILMLFANAIILVGLIVLLIIINPLLVIFTVVLLCILYAIIFLFFQKHLKRFGDLLVEANRLRFLSAAETLGGVKTIKLWNAESLSLNAFDLGSSQFSRSHAAQQTFSIIPSYIVEVVVFGAIIVLTLTLTMSQRVGANQALGDMLPMIGLYTITLMRMKPLAQGLYQGIAALRFGDTLISNLYQETKLLANVPRNKKNVNISFQSKLELKNITYHYPKKEIPVLKNISLSINKNSTLGILGATGSGKSTVADILLTLLQPTTGRMMVDGKDLASYDKNSWHDKIGYVTQDIYLLDKTITENIAFATPPSKIDHAKVMHCAQLACIHNFINEELSHGYDTRVGERGISLSGGQRQRLGIARAFYKSAEILIFDEATSALDAKTEKMVLESILSFTKSKTIIFITHRTSLLELFDKIIVINRGQIIDRGSYKYLLEKGVF
jgi:ATP-binding cassette, subfamily B, bacterial PglK